MQHGCKRCTRVPKVLQFISASFTVSFQAVDISQRMLEGKVLYGKVALKCGETLWLDPIEQRITLEGNHLCCVLGVGVSLCTVHAV